MASVKEKEREHVKHSKLLSHFTDGDSNSEMWDSSYVCMCVYVKERGKFQSTVKCLYKLFTETQLVSEWVSCLSLEADSQIIVPLSCRRGEGRRKGGTGEREKRNGVEEEAKKKLRQRRRERWKIFYLLAILYLSVNESSCYFSLLIGPSITGLFDQSGERRGERVTHAEVKRHNYTLCTCTSNHLSENHSFNQQREASFLPVLLFSLLLCDHNRLLDVGKSHVKRARDVKRSQCTQLKRTIVNSQASSSWGSKREKYTPF